MFASWTFEPVVLGLQAILESLDPSDDALMTALGSALDGAKRSAALQRFSTASRDERPAALQAAIDEVSEYVSRCMKPK